MENISESIQLKIEIDDDASYMINQMKDEPIESEITEEVNTTQEVNSDLNSNSNITFSPGSIKNYEEMLFKCRYRGCGRAFRIKKLLWFHMRAHLEHRPDKCTFVGGNKSFYCTKKHQVHLLEPGEEKVYRCPHSGCKRSFKHEYQMLCHMKFHNHSKPFSCTFYECGEVFTTRRTYEHHQRLHNEEQPLTCGQDDCFERFKTRNTLRRHLVSYFDNTPPSGYVVGRNQSFEQRQDLTDHARTRCLNETETREPGYHICDVCGNILDIQRELRDYTYSQSVNIGCDVKSEPLDNDDERPQNSFDGIVKSEPIDTDFDAIENISTNCENIPTSYFHEDAIQIEVSSLYGDAMETEVERELHPQNSFDGIIKSEPIDTDFDAIGSITTNCENTAASPLGDDAIKIEYSSFSHDGIKLEDDEMKEPVNENFIQTLNEDESMCTIEATTLKPSSAPTLRVRPLRSLQDGRLVAEMINLEMEEMRRADSIEELEHKKRMLKLKKEYLLLNIENMELENILSRN